MLFIFNVLKLYLFAINRALSRGGNRISCFTGTAGYLFHKKHCWRDREETEFFGIHFDNRFSGQNPVMFCLLEEFNIQIFLPSDIKIRYYFTEACLRVVFLFLNIYINIFVAQVLFWLESPNMLRYFVLIRGMQICKL